MSTRKRILLLGATGSIGRSTLDVLRRFPDHFQLVGVTANTNTNRLAEIIAEFQPSCAALADTEAAEELRIAIDTHTCRVFSGAQGIIDLIDACEADLCVSATVGAAGLRPTLAAIDCGMTLALANKESLVMAGRLVTESAKTKHVTILPVDSEHSALFQCMHGEAAASVERLILTASGGPFRECPAKAMQTISPAQALAHPTWQMGPKITIDSATLANKALEVIEAHWLFGLPYDRLEVVIHPQSIVHGLAELSDGSMLAHLAQPDMRIPVQYALSYPERWTPPEDARLTARDLTALQFDQPDWERFPLLELGLEAGRVGGLAPAVFSAANEKAVYLFLENALPFPAIAEAVADALATVPSGEATTLDAIDEADRAARAAVQRRRNT